MHFFALSRYEKQVQKCLAYFERLRSKQLQRRAAKDDQWELSFLAPSTWTNLRMTCRGFFAYAHALIGYAENAAEGQIMKFSCVSPAHSNSSAIEAWFSGTRGARQDTATSYPSWVANRTMIGEVVELSSNNKMYDRADVGETNAGMLIGPSEFIKFHNSRETQMTEVVDAYFRQRANNAESVPSFLPTTGSVLPSSLSSLEIDALQRLLQKTLPYGYADAVARHNQFRQWLRLSLGTPTEWWFQLMLEYTQSAKGLEQFDDICQHIQDKMFQMTVHVLQNRNKDNVSFELDLHQYHKSDEFASLCRRLLPQPC